MFFRIFINFTSNSMAMKTLSLIFTFVSAIAFGQETQPKKLPELKPDSTKIFKLDARNLEKKRLHSDSINDKMPTIKVENPELYTGLVVKEKGNTLPIPNASDKKPAIQMENLEHIIPKNKSSKK